MRIPRIFTDQRLVRGETLELEQAPAHHLARVLRMQAGRELVLFNGCGGEFSAVIAEANKRRVVVTLGDFAEPETESPLDSELLVGISRGERMDWVVQKATELGITAIQPVFTERTEVKLSGERLVKRMRHWRQVVISACEQCGRNRLPVLQEARPLSEALSVSRAHARYVLHHRTDRQLLDMERPQSLALLVGPEGGLSHAEIALAEDAGFAALCFGPRVMRTETAPVAALAILQHHWGDM